MSQLIQHILARQAGPDPAGLSRNLSCTHLCVLYISSCQELLNESRQHQSVQWNPLLQWASHRWPSASAHLLCPLLPHLRNHGGWKPGPLCFHCAVLPTPHSMYFFLSNLSFLLPSGWLFSHSPQNVDGAFSGCQTISFSGCVIQTTCFVIFAVTEFFLLASVAYDCYVAICHPLLYMQPCLRGSVAVSDCQLCSGPDEYDAITD